MLSTMLGSVRGINFLIARASAIRRLSAICTINFLIVQRCAKSAINSLIDHTDEAPHSTGHPLDLAVLFEATEDRRDCAGAALRGCCQITVANLDRRTRWAIAPKHKQHAADC